MDPKEVMGSWEKGKQVMEVSLADKDDEWLCAHKVIMAAICYPFTE